MFNNKTKFMGVTLFFIMSVSFFVVCSAKTRKVEVDENLIGKPALCPVTGDTFTIHERTPVVLYKDVEYYMCCPGCDIEFMKNPEKYIKNIKEMPSSSNPDQQIDYWTCSMHPEIKADKEGNCPICGMVLIPVYKRAAHEDQLHLGDRDIELAGIRTTPVTKQNLYKEIRAVGRVAFDPELVTAQEEYIGALNTAERIIGSDEAAANRTLLMVQNAAYKLRLLGMDDAEIENLRETRKGESSLVIPENEVWVYADVYESDIAWIKKGQRVFVTSIAYPGEEFTGTVKSISPLLNPQTHSASVRIHISDKNTRLKPGMYVDANIRATYMPAMAGPRSSMAMHSVLAIPRESVLDTGDRKVVWVYLGEGQFQPREVRLGPEGSIQGAPPNKRYYPVLGGLKENELVVTNGNFLVDSESRITGVAAIGYGGALGVEAKPQAPQVHQH